MPKWLDKGMTTAATFAVKALAAINPLSLGGCKPANEKDLSQRDPNSTERTCWYPEGVDGEICERIYVTEGGHTLYIEEGLLERNNVTSRTIDFLKEQLDVCAQEVKDDLEITPTHSHLEQTLWSTELEVCGSAPACGFGRSTWHSVHDLLLAAIQEKLSRGELTADGSCQNLFSTIHEFSHALRMPPMLTHTEEGLARYSEDLWGERNISEAVSNELIAGEYRLNDEVWNVETEDASYVREKMDPITDIWIRSLAGGAVVFGYNASQSQWESCTEDCSTSPVEMGSCVRAFGNNSNFACAEVAPDNAVAIGIYDQVGRRRHKISCSESGFAPRATEYNIPHGIALVRGEEELYSEYDLLSPDLEYGSEADKAKYSVYFCFYDRIRQEAGGHAVKEIVSRMMEAGREHWNVALPFPFFQTVQEVTGLSELETEDMFDTYQVSVSDDDHRVGGMNCIDD